MSYETEGPLQQAAGDVRRRLCRLARDASSGLAPFYGEAERQLLTYPVDDKRLRDLLGPGVGWAGRERPSGDEIRAFVEAWQLDVVLVALFLAGDSVPTGLMALGVGIDSYHAYRVYRATTGVSPSLVQWTAGSTKRASGATGFEPGFDALSWHRLVEGELVEHAARFLARVLLRLYPEAFAGGLPPARSLGGDLDGFVSGEPWHVPGLSQDEAAAARDRAVARLVRPLEAVAALVPQPFADLILYPARHLDEDLSEREVCKRLGLTDTGVSGKLVYYTGYTLPGLVRKIRLAITLCLLTDRRFRVGRVAEAVGLTTRALRGLCKTWTGVRLAAVRETLKRTLGHPARDVWLRVEDGDLAVGEVRAAAAWLLHLHRGVFDEQARRVEDAPPLVLVPRLAGFPKRLAKAAAAAAAAARPADTALGEDLDRLREIAEVLTPGPFSRADRNIERLLAVHEDAPFLYRVREIQCMVTADRKLRQGLPLVREPWQGWLRVRAGASYEEWRAVVDALVPPVEALELYLEADDRRRELLALPEAERAETLRGRPPSYLLARACLFAEEHYHRGRGTQELPLAETRTAVAEARRLYDDCYSSVPLRGDHPPRRPRPTLPTPAADVYALAQARAGNLHRIDGNLRLALPAVEKARAVHDEVPLSSYVEAEIASLHASALKDEGSNLELAEERADDAGRGFEGIDEHLAARMLLIKAEIQRLRHDDGCVATVRLAVEKLDGRRQPGTLEMAHNNLLHYLLEQDRRDEADHWRRVLPFPAARGHRASRSVVEGRIELAWGSLDRAETFLEDAAARFKDLRRSGDVMVSLLYQAAVHERQGSIGRVRERLAAAADLADAGGYVVRIALRDLIQGMDDVEDLFEEILRIAAEADECVGSGLRPPLTPALSQRERE